MSSADRSSRIFHHGYSRLAKAGAYSMGPAGDRKFAASKRQGHQMRSGIGRDESARLADIESETPIEGGIAEDEDSEPSRRLRCARFPARINRLPMPVRRYSGSTATGPSASAGNGAFIRENMAWPTTVSSSTATSEKTESPAARRSSTNRASADRPNAISSTMRMAATSPGVSSRTIISSHQHRLDRGRRLAQSRQEAFDHLG